MYSYVQMGHVYVVSPKPTRWFCAVDIWNGTKPCQAFIKAYDRMKAVGR